MMRDLPSPEEHVLKIGEPGIGRRPAYGRSGRGSACHREL